MDLFLINISHVSPFKKPYLFSQGPGELRHEMHYSSNQFKNENIFSTIANAMTFRNIKKEKNLWLLKLQYLL